MEFEKEYESPLPEMEGVEGLKANMDQYVELRNKKDEISAKLKEVNKELEPVEFAVIKGMEELDIQSLKATSGLMVTLSVSSFPRIKDKTAVIPWMEEHGFKDLFTINAQTFRGFFNERMKNGEEVPSEGVEQYIKTTLSVKGR